jgi:hypothetical protein
MQADLTRTSANMARLTAKPYAHSRFGPRGNMMEYVIVYRPVHKSKLISAVSFVNRLTKQTKCSISTPGHFEVQNAVHMWVIQRKNTYQW